MIRSLAALVLHVFIFARWSPIAMAAAFHGRLAEESLRHVVGERGPLTWRDVFIRRPLPVFTAAPEAGCQDESKANG